VNGIIAGYWLFGFYRLKSSLFSISTSCHTTSSPCHCRILLDKLRYQLAAAPLLLPPSSDDQAGTGAFASAFHACPAPNSTAPPFFRPRRLARLKVAVYAGKSGGRSGGSANSGSLLGKVMVPLDLKAAEGKPVVFHSGWVPVGKPHPTSGGWCSSSTASRVQPPIA
jgi:hypothetical protein